jgi:T-complex protein 1 subunit delta
VHSCCIFYSLTSASLPLSLSPDDSIRAFAEALEVVPYTLAENAGLNPINIVTELRKAHAEGATNAGINVKKNRITDMLEANVLQPLLVNTSAITLATECVCMILKIDDVVPVR